MIEFSATRLPLPLPKYAQVCVDDFILRHGKHLHNLANRTADERAALDNRGTESLVARELAHQWFGI